MQPFRNIQAYQKNWIIFRGRASQYLLFSSTSSLDVEQIFRFDVTRPSKTFDIKAGPCSPKHNSVPFTVLNNFFVWMLCRHLKTFKSMADRAPRHLLSRPSSFHRVKKFFGLNFMQTLNNIQTSGCSCHPKHGPDGFTLFNTSLLWCYAAF